MIAMSGMQKEGHITMLYVLPVFQRRGCGRCLLEEMKAYAANQYQLQRGDVIGNAGMDSGLFHKTSVSSNGGNTAVFICSDAGKNRGTRDI